MNFEFNKASVAIIVIFVSVLLIFSAVYANRTGSRAGDSEEAIPLERSLVTNYSRFFTISNAAETYINFLAREDVDNLLLLLSKDYIRANNLNQNNLLNNIDTLSGYVYRFQARTMYQYPLSETTIKYYVHGHLREVNYDGWGDPVDYYIIIVFDSINSTFSVEPYNGISFRGGN